MCAPSFARSVPTYKPREPITAWHRCRSATRSANVAGGWQSSAIPSSTPAARSSARGGRRGKLEPGRSGSHGAAADRAPGRDGRRDPYPAGGAGSARCFPKSAHRVADRGTVGRTFVRSRDRAPRAAIGRAPAGRVGAHGQLAPLAEIPFPTVDVRANCESVERRALGAISSGDRSAGSNPVGASGAMVSGPDRLWLRPAARDSGKPVVHPASDSPGGAHHRTECVGGGRSRGDEAHGADGDVATRSGG